MRNIFIWALLLAIMIGCGKSSSDGTEKGEEPADSLVALAEQGDAEAQYELGRLYYFGDSVAQNYEKAAKWFTKAAEQGFVEAQCMLGLCYNTGEGVEKDSVKGIGLITKAAEQGLVDAQFFLGHCYYYGIIVEQDYKKAVEWWTKAAEQGHADAQYNLGWRYYEGEGVEQDYKKAFEWFTKAAKKGDPLAVGALWYYYIESVAQNYEKADEWFIKAMWAIYPHKPNGWIYMSDELVEMGYVGEQYAYGEAYYVGRKGVKQDYEKAFECFMNVVESGDDSNWVYVDAEFYLGLCYYNGDGIEQDYREAVKWWRKAAEQGLAVAEYNLGVCYEFGYGVTKNYTEADGWYLKAGGQKKNAEARNRMGDRYMDGMDGHRVVPTCGSPELDGRPLQWNKVISLQRLLLKRLRTL